MSHILTLIQHKGHSVNSDVSSFLTKEGFVLRGDKFAFEQDVFIDKRLYIHVYHEGRMTCRLEDRFWGDVFFEKETDFTTDNIKKVYRSLMEEIGKSLQQLG